MDVWQIRLANLLSLIDEAGNASELARRIGSDPNYISQIISPKAKRNVGHSFARRIEKAFGKPSGWMDQIHHGETRAALPAAPKLSKETLKIAQDWTSLSKPNRKAVREMINALKKQKGGKRN